MYNNRFTFYCSGSLFYIVKLPNFTKLLPKDSTTFTEFDIPENFTNESGPDQSEYESLMYVAYFELQWITFCITLVKGPPKMCKNFAKIQYSP